MPEGSKASEQRTSTPPTNGFNPFYMALLEGNQRAYARMIDSMFKVSQEIAQFTQNRLQEDLAAWTTLTACRDPREAMDTQRVFAEKAAQQYTDEINKLSRMMMNITGDSLSSLRQEPGATP